MSDAITQAGPAFEPSAAYRIGGKSVASRGDPVAPVSQHGLPLRMADGRPVPPRHSTLQRAVKRALDVTLSVTALVMLSPVLLMVALGIKLADGGPVLFRQQRLGRDGRTFEMLKFRSMRVDDCDGSGLRHTAVGDSRVTPIGRFIRASSIDELPQLWNIARGDMSLIGPRPMVPGQRAAGMDYRQLVPYYEYRLLMRPGLSGWAQANGLRGPTDEIGPSRARIDHDCAYIQNFSIALDVTIIGRTIVREFLTGTGV
jgi:lipopolysaccharide/colanic/teichoic acid biosynthesis glycosyltransferase